MAAVIKVLLMMHNTTIVPSLWYSKENENPKLKLEDYGLTVPTSCVAWDVKACHARTACVNSFGFGGTNAHAVISQFRSSLNETKSSNMPEIIPPIIALSAYDMTSLILSSKHFCSSIQNRSYNIYSLSWTSTCRRDHRSKRKAFLVESLDDLVTKCQTFVRQQPPAYTYEMEKRLVFVFCGVGTTWVKMGQSLIKNVVFERKIDEIDDYLSQLAGWKVKEKMNRYSDEVVCDPLVGHVKIFAYQVALAGVWKHFGITPDIIIGQSVGEVAAAHVAGFIDLETAVRVIFHRSNILANVNSGSMAVFKNIDTKIVEKHCQGTKSLGIAVYISPLACTVAGDEFELKEMESVLRETTTEQFRVIYLNVKCAYHSKVVEKAALDIGAKIGDVTLQKQTTTLISIVTGELVENGLFGCSSYWSSNVRMPVLFGKAIKNARSLHEHTIYIEVGPSSVLASHIHDIFSNIENISVVASVKPNQESKTLGQALCELYEYGLDIKWENVFQTVQTLTDLPVYLGQKVKNLYRSQNVLQKLQPAESLNHTSGSYIHIKSSNDIELTLEAHVNINTTPFVYEHEISGLILLPGVFYAEIGYVIGKSLTKTSADKITVTLEFLLPVKLEKTKNLTLQITTENRADEIFFHVQNNQRVTCKGRTKIDNSINRSEIRKINIRSLESSIIVSLKAELMKAELYQRFASHGFTYGESFQMIQRLITNGSESLTELEVPENIVQSAHLLTIHPCILDCLLQSTILFIEGDLFKTIRLEKRSFLPVAYEEIRCFRAPTRYMIGYTKLTNMHVFDATLQLHFNAVLLTPDGEIVVQVTNFMTCSKPIGTQAPLDLNYKLSWFESQRYLKDRSEVGPKIFLLSRNLTETDLKLFDGNESVTTFNGNFTCAKSYVKNAFQHLSKETAIENIDVICFFVKGFTTDNNVLNEEGILFLHNNISETVQLLIEMLRYVREKNLSKPIYVVTECTQLVTESSNVKVSCNGAPVWGCTRSANVEFFTELVLVDLQPGISACRDILLNFIGRTYKSISETPTEILIDCDKIYISEFSKIGRFIKPSNMRLSGQTVTKGADAFYQLRSTVNVNNSDFFLQRLTTPENNKHLKELVKLQVTSVTLPMQSSSLLATLIDPVWRESNVADAPVFAIEYKSYTHTFGNKETPFFAKCKAKIETIDDNLDNRWESIALHPTTMFSEVGVPKNAVVRMSEFQTYIPGMLSLSVLFWKLVKHIAVRSSVFINCKSPSGLTFAVLQQMLVDKKQCQVSHVLEMPSQSVNATIVNLENVDRNVSGILRFKRIFLFKEQVNPQTLATLTSSKDKHVSVFSITFSLSRTEIETNICPVVKWLKRNANEIMLLTSDTDTEYRELLYKNIPVKKENSDVVVINSSQKLFGKSDVYIVTGGLSGLGLEKTKVLAEKGAGIIATLTRRDPTTEIQAIFKQIESSTHCKIICLKGDVSDLSSVRNAVLTLKSLVPKSQIKGIFHCAGVSRGKTLATISTEDLEFVLRPKVLGTLNLHLVASEFSLRLDYFMTTSSISSLIGSPGQSNYGAANSFIDSFMLWRREKGLPGQAINWGALAIGMAADPKLLDMFTDRGFNLMPVPEVRQCFQTCVLQNASGVVFATMNWDLISKYFSNQGMRRTKLQFVNVIKELASSVLQAETGEDDALDFNVEMLKDVDDKTRHSRLLFMVKYISSKLIGIDLEALKPSSTMAELPFDSMSMVTLVNLLQEKTGYKISDSFIADTSQTLEDIANHLQRHLFN